MSQAFRSVVLAVHLHAFCRQYPSVAFDSYPWMALYRDPVARTMFLVSATPLPLAVTLWLSYNAAGEGSSTASRERS